ncbi:MAG: hypothetical protein J6M38_03210, partial [Lentisphaeria bacterium]|nr:hypothetical protein [Lentisphaeria bacterium]
MKKNISSILLMSLLLSFAASAISCGENPTAPETTPTDSEAAAPNESVETEPIAEEEDLGAGNVLELFEQTSFNGTDFRILGSKYYNTTIGGRQFPDEESNGEILNDELIKRDQLLEAYFDINVTYNHVEYEDWGELPPLVNQSVSAGDDIVDLLFGSLEITLKPCLTAGSLVDMMNVPNLDFKNEWWHKTVTEDLNFSGKVFFASGNITPRAATSAFVVAFNKNLLTDYQIEAPYDEVREGTWTLDRLQTICTNVYQDVDESGSKSDGDFFGLVFEGGSQNAFYTSVGGTIFELQPDGMPLWTADNEKNVGVIERLSAMIRTEDFHSPVYTYTANQAFRESRALFISFACCDLSLLREMEDDYGILPFPKLDEAQENYYCSANRW